MGVRPILLAMLALAAGGCPLEDESAGPEDNLIANGDFELDATEGDPVPAWSPINGGFLLDDLHQVSGARSLRITAPGGAPPDFWANQALPAGAMEAGASYRLSASLRAGAGAYVSVWIHNFEIGYVTELLEVSEKADWQYVETSFTAPASSDTFWVVLDVSPFDYAIDADGWFDDVMLVPN